MVRPLLPALLVALLGGACASAPEAPPPGDPLQGLGAWPATGVPAVRVVADRAALDACLEPGGLLAAAGGPSVDAVDFGRHWCVVATDARKAAEDAVAYLAVGAGGAGSLAVVGRDDRATRVRSVRAWLVPRGKVTKVVLGGEELTAPVAPSKAPVLPVLDVRGPSPAPAGLPASWRLTEAAELRAALAACGTAAPRLPDDWVDFATECVVVALLPGPGPWRLRTVEEEGVDVLTLSGAPAGPADVAPQAIWLKLPRRNHTFTLVHRCESPSGPEETVLGTWPPLR